MTCYACHTSWMTSCSGCHLPQEQNVASPMQHYEGTVTRNYASYNPQVIRTDAFMLGVNGTTKGHRIAPVRSSSALVISSTNAQRQRIYIQQPPISAAGYSSQAFNPHVPHTVRSRETQGCGSCHISDANDNNAWMAQLLLQGTNFVNFIGRFAYVATGREGFEAVAVTGVGRAAGGDRIIAAEDRLSRTTTRSTRKRTRSSPSRITITPMTRAAFRCAASMRSSRAGRAASKSSTSPTSTTKTSPSASSARRSRHSANARS
jgi:hypothetical protein